MEHRRLRPGDSLDDYCPRERRLTDHVVVAVVDDVVKQTRCSACDTEHVYKGGRVPPRRQKQSSTATLYQRVLEEVSEDVAGNGDVPEPLPNLVVRPERKPPKGRRTATSASGEAPPGPLAAAPSPPAEAPPPEPPASAESLLAEPSEADRGDDGPVHRRLIRATLPRPEGQPPAPRPLPEFTMRQLGARGGQGRPGAKGGQRFGGPWGGAPGGQGGHRFGASQPGQRDTRGRQPKSGRPRGPRPHHKKSR